MSVCDSTTQLINDGDNSDTDGEIAPNADRLLEDITTVEYFKELCDSGFKLLSLFYSLFSLLFLVGMISSALSVSPTRNELFDISVINVNIFNILILIVTIITLCVTKKYRIRKIENEKFRIIFYTITIPIGILAFVCLILYIVNINIGRICVLSSFTRYMKCTELFLIVSSLLIIDNRNRVDADILPWFPRSIHNLTISLLVIGAAKMFLGDMTTRNCYDFIRSSQLFFNITFNNFAACNRTEINQESMNSQIIERIISLGVPLFSVLTIFSLVTTSKDPIKAEDIRRVVLRSAVTVTIGVLILLAGICPLLTFVIEIFNQPNVSQRKSLTFLVVVSCIRILISIVGIVFVRMKYKNVTTWPRLDSVALSLNLFDRYFIWFGCLGQLLSACGHMSYALFQVYYFLKEARQSSDNDTIYLVLLILTVSSSVLLVAQTLYQSCVIELCMDRHWPPRNRTRKIYPSLIIMFINIAGFVMCSYEDLLVTKSLMPKNMFISLLSSFSTYSSKIGRMLQHLHAAVYFYLLAKITEYSCTMEIPAPRSHAPCNVELYVE